MAERSEGGRQPGSARDGSGGLEQLGRAIAVFQAWRRSRAEPWQRVLDRHEDLRELLEPLWSASERSDRVAGAGDGVTIDAADGRPSPADVRSSRPAGGEPGAAVASESPALASMVGRRFGDFRIVGEIGRGGMGAVYEAVRLSLDQRVALKVLPAHSTLHPASVARFKREANTVARLDHPGIVKVLAAGSEGDFHYYAMELVAGATLSDVVERVRADGLAGANGASIGAAVTEAVRGPVTRSRSATETTIPGDGPGRESDARRTDPWRRGYVESVVGIVLQVADALEYAHAAGVIHRDVKPSNILLRPDGRVVLTDFGLARDEGLPELTRTGDFAGTPHYVSPEQALGRPREIDHRTDVFSLGVTLYELVTLRRPFDGETTQEVLQSILVREPVNPQRFNRQLPQDLAAVIQKALEKERSRRYATAGDLAADLRAVLDYRPVQARRTSVFARLLRWRRREPWKATMAAVVAVSVPTFAAMAGFMLAKADAIAAGEQRLLLERLDEILDSADLYADLGDHERVVERARAAFELAPGRPESCFALATALRGRSLVTGSRQDAEAALRVLDGVPDLLARYVALRRIRVEVLRQLGRGEEAETFAATELAGSAAEPSGALDFYLESIRELIVADESRGQEHYERAFDLALGAVLRAEQSRPLFHFQLARTAAWGAGAGLARSLALALLRQWPESAAARYWAGSALREVDPHESARILAPLLGQVDDDSATRARAVLAVAYANSGRPLEAVREYRELLERRPDEAASWVYLGRLLLDAGNVDEAEQALRRSLAIDSANERAYVVLSELEARRGDTGVALDICREGLAATGGDIQLRIMEGITLGRLGRWNEAETAFRQAVESAPDNVFALSNLATLLARGDRLVEARTLFERTAELRPQLVAPWYHAGLCSLKLGEPAVAVPAFRAALRRDPHHLQARGKLFESLRELGRGDELRAEIDRWVADCPDAAAAWLERARLGLETGDTAAALASARRAVELDAGDPAALLVLAEVLFVDGAKGEAADRVQEALGRIAALRAERAAAPGGVAPAGGAVDLDTLERAARSALARYTR